MASQEIQNPSLYQTLLADVRRWDARKTGWLSIFFYTLRRPGFHAVFLYRLSACCARKGKVRKVLSVILEHINLTLNGCDIQSEAVVGPGFIIYHPIGIVIGKATIGSNVSIKQSVTLGIRWSTDDYDDPSSYPTIEDNVDISAGAVVLGNIKIGRGAQIGANAVVLCDVPENCTAVGVPARILEKRKSVAS